MHLLPELLSAEPAADASGKGRWGAASVRVGVVPTAACVLRTLWHNRSHRLVPLTVSAPGRGVANFLNLLKTDFRRSSLFFYPHNSVFDWALLVRK